MNDHLWSNMRIIKQLAFVNTFTDCIQTEYKNNTLK